MSQAFHLPEIGAAVAEGYLVTWFKGEGDPIREGEPLLDVQFEKVTTEITAPLAGWLERILIPQGQTVRVGEVLALLRTEAEGPGAEGPGDEGEPLRGEGPAADSGAPGGRLEPLAPEQRAVAGRLVQSLRDAAQLTLGREVDVTDLLRRRRPESSITDLILKAVAMALPDHPRISAQWREEGLLLPEGVHLGFAVAVGPSLVVPVIRDARAKSLDQIAADRRLLTEKARQGRLSPGDVGGGTFTVTNLGPQGVDFFTPILNPPQSAILGVGRVVERPALVAGRLEGRRYLVLSLTFDHRVINGAPAALFLGRVATLLEEPEGWM